MVNCAACIAIRAALAARGEKRHLILVPESAHGTNPATAALCGYAVERSKPRPMAGSILRI